ncbi:conserved hypothetical protein [metagenome]|uniref:Uncharacterized protein n=1 Tax=metagenome TaxID=256318 RepID=A0A2P2BWK2_9ZZZZ
MPTAADATRSPAMGAPGLRLAVASLRSGETRRSFPPAVHAGRLGDRTSDFELSVEQVLDHGLRTEVVAALLSRALLWSDQPGFWLTRSGELDAEDLDLDWFSAARAAYGEAGVPLRMAVITKRGWRDPSTGLGRSWKRLRIRS